MKCLPPQSSLLYSKNGVYKGLLHGQVFVMVPVSFTLSSVKEFFVNKDKPEVIFVCLFNSFQNQTLFT